MENKVAATNHGAPVESRLRLHADHSDDGVLMREAADTIEGLRPEVIETQFGLEAVAIGVVVRSSSGTIATRFDSTRGVIFGDDRSFPWKRLSLPVTVLWQP